jgi:cob(I)alamin adenosyltransferase
MEPGRIIVYTGDGKGKTTAALGMVMRALGHGLRVCVVQFIKGQGDYGERLMAAHLEGLDWVICGEGFVFTQRDQTKNREAARRGLERAAEIVASDRYDLVVFDEITYLPTYGFAEVEDLVRIVRTKPSRLSIIMTGRDAREELIELADTVTEMKCVKHGYEQGITAQKGVEF